jgi:hypothetical protein
VNDYHYLHSLLNPNSSSFITKSPTYNCFNDWFQWMHLFSSTSYLLDSLLPSKYPTLITSLFHLIDFLQPFIYLLNPLLTLTKTSCMEYLSSQFSFVKPSGKPSQRIQVWECFKILSPRQRLRVKARIDSVLKVRSSYETASYSKGYIRGNYNESKPLAKNTAEWLSPSISVSMSKYESKIKSKHGWMRKEE